MSAKVEISKLEHTLLLLATSIIPILAFGFILTVLLTVFYEYILPIPPQPNFAVDDWSAKPTLPLFRICAGISLTISFILIFYKRFFLSILTFILPIICFVPFVVIVHWRVQEILETSRDLETMNLYNEKSLVEIVFYTLDNLNIVFLSFIVVLIF